MANILQVVRPAGGGMAAHVRLLAEGLGGRGFAVTVAAPEEVRGVMEAAGAAVHPLRPAQGRAAADLADVLRLALLIRTGCFDVVHAHGFRAAPLSIAAARLAGRVRTVYTAYGDEAAFSAVRTGVLRRYDAVVAVSGHTRTSLLAARSVDPRAVQVIYNGIEPSGRLPPPPAGGGPVVGTVARLAPGKGVEIFLAAARLIRQACPRARFMVAGDGPLWADLRELTAEYGLAGHLVFTGRLREAAGLMPLLDVFVLPSRQGGVPLVLLEAMARARPVVAAGAGGVPEVLTEGTGLVVPPGDAAALAGQVVRLLNDSALAARLGGAARRRVAARFGAARMQDETAALYRRVLAGALEGVPGA